MRKKNVKIQMLGGNRLKVYVGAGFEISSTLINGVNILPIQFCASENCITFT